MLSTERWQPPRVRCGFKLDATGKETVLHTFTGTDGALPEATVIQDAKGNLYGVTSLGGTYHYGTVFKLDPENTETLLHSFTDADGYGPGGLLRDKAGNLYGDTYSGGTYGYGTVFKVDTGGNETVLYSFTGGADGANPSASLLMDNSGNLYGITYEGGSSSQGAVYKLSNSGQETVLHSFAGGTTDGCNPLGSPAMDHQGNLYGTTNLCGSSNIGTVWKLSKNGTETVLHSFIGSDGSDPSAGVILDANGNLYGVARAGGEYNYGTVYELNKKGVLTVLHSFVGSDGTNPSAGVILDASGNLYGTALLGGTDGYGTVFKIMPAAATTATFSSSPTPSTYGEAVTFTATVTSSIGAPPDGETVSFMKGKTVLGTGTLSGGSATLTTSMLSVGTNSMTAVYGGDANFGASTSKVDKQLVNKATTKTTLASSLNPSDAGQSVIFTATVMPQYGGAPTGSVTFKDGATTLKIVAVNRGTAKYTTNSLAPGTHNLTATYNGSTEFSGSSGSLTQNVYITPTLISITVAPVNAAIGVGETEQFMAFGSYNDGSQKNITSSVTWKSSRSYVATIAPGGLATGVAAGTSTITAKSGTISGSTDLTVSP